MSDQQAKRTPGRPPVANSARQQRMAERQRKIESGELKKGRPVSGTSKRQQQLAARAERAAQGIAPKRGRPKMVKVEAE